MSYKDFKSKPVKKGKRGDTEEVSIASPTANGSLRTRWWQAKGDDVYNAITSVVNGINQNQDYRSVMNLRYARLYANQEILGFGASLYDRTAGSLPVSNRVTYNVVKSCIDTAASKIAKMQPRIMALTSDGDYELQQKAKNLTKYVDGQFDLNNIYELGTQAFVDSCVFGSGFLKIYQDGKRIHIERVFPNEVLVDDADGMNAKPSQMHHIKYMQRDIVLELFGDTDELYTKIKTCATGMRSDRSFTSTADLILVRESWRLPTCPGAGDGRHAITIENATLVNEPYTKEYFPLLKIDWTRKLLGYFGAGLAEELIGLQVEINKLLRNIQQAQHLACVPRVFVEAGSKVNEGNFNNKIGSFVEYQGAAPIISAGQGMPTEVYQHLETLYKRSFEITGISLLSATSMKPSGLNSSLALREYQDIETERFAITARNYENYFVKAAEIILDLSKDLYENKKDLSVKSRSRKFVENIPWKDVDMEQDVYSLKLFPVNILPAKPEGRIQKIQELVQAGFFSKEEAFSLIDYPDLDAIAERKNAPYNITMKMIYEMLKTGKYISPEPFMNIELAKTEAQYSYLQAKIKGVPEERLELLRRFMEDCVSLEALAAQGMQQMQDPNAAEPLVGSGEQGMAPPLGVPEAAQPSDLLPISTATPPL